MPNTNRVRIPTYRKHKSTGQGVVTLNGRDHYLGRFGTAASKKAYERLIAEWLAGGQLTPRAEGAMSVGELILRYWPFVQSYYRHADGSLTKEVGDMLYSLRPLNHLYGQTPLPYFGPIALKAVRDLMINGYDHPKYGPQPPLSRGVVNQRVKPRIRRVFRWAVEHELVPSSVLLGLQAVPGLKRGRTYAYETKPVLPVSRAVVEDTLPLLRPMQADMVMLQLETGMRSGELVIMRAIDIDMTGSVWLYRPSTHKTLHHGHGRVVPIGPKGKKIVRRYLTLDMQAYLFAPSRNMAERASAMRLTRKSKVQPSQVDRRKRRPKKKPGNVYTVDSYRRGITEAIRRHNTGKPKAEHIPHWHPHRLRHLRALEIKREAGLDVARAVLGHRSPSITEMYATLDIAKGMEVMARIG